MVVGGETGGTEGVPPYRKGAHELEKSSRKFAKVHLSWAFLPVGSSVASIELSGWESGWVLSRVMESPTGTGGSL